MGGFGWERAEALGIPHGMGRYGVSGAGHCSVAQTPPPPCLLLTAANRRPTPVGGLGGGSRQSRALCPEIWPPILGPFNQYHVFLEEAFSDGWMGRSTGAGQGPKQSGGGVLQQQQLCHGKGASPTPSCPPCQSACLVVFWQMQRARVVLCSEMCCRVHPFGITLCRSAITRCFAWVRALFQGGEGGGFDHRIFYDKHFLQQKFLIGEGFLLEIFG